MESYDLVVCKPKKWKFLLILQINTTKTTKHNLLTPKNDRYVISPNSLCRKSDRKVKRIKIENVA